jgi:hypothetical protein
MTKPPVCLYNGLAGVGSLLGAIARGEDAVPALRAVEDRAVHNRPHPRSTRYSGLGTGGLACCCVAYSSLSSVLVSPCVVAGDVSAPGASRFGDQA